MGLIISNSLVELLHSGLQTIFGHIGITYFLSERAYICLKLRNFSLFFLSDLLYLHTCASNTMLVVLNNTSMTALDLRNFQLQVADAYFWLFFFKLYGKRLLI